jgi:hypothetical protein
MGASGNLGLLFEIGADPTAASAAIERLVGSLDRLSGDVESKTAPALRRGGKQLEDSLIGPRESMRLLSEEFGVHLPRAVTGAIGQIVPAISALGPVLLGAFAVARRAAARRG